MNTPSGLLVLSVVLVGAMALGSPVLGGNNQSLNPLSIIHVYPSMSTGEIQNVLSSLSPGDTVVFEPGVYHAGELNISGVSNILLYGYGAVIDATGYDYGFRIGNTAGNVSISGFSIRYASNGILVDNLGGLTIRDVSIYHTLSGLVVESVSNVSLIGITVVSASNMAVHIRSAGYIRIINSTINDSSNGIVAESASNVYVFNTTISRCTYGLNVSNSGLELIYSQIISNNVGVTAWNTGSLRMYLNRFIGNDANAVLHYVSSSALTSGEPLDYSLNGEDHRGLLGNYWGRANCTDIDGDGIGDEPVKVFFDPYTNTEFIDSAPICPYYKIKAAQIEFISPDKLLIKTSVSETIAKWRPGENISVYTTATSIFIINHPVLGRLVLKWPSTLKVLNITMLQLPNGVRIATTTRVENWTIKGSIVELILRDNATVSLAVKNLEIILVEKDNKTINPETRYMIYKENLWGLASIGDPVKIKIILRVIPAPEPPITPLVLAIALSILLIRRMATRRF